MASLYRINFKIPSSKWEEEPLYLLFFVLKWAHMRRGNSQNHKPLRVFSSDLSFFFILGGGGQFINEQSCTDDNQLKEKLNKRRSATNVKLIVWNLFSHKQEKMIGYEEFQTKTRSIVLVCYRLNFQNLFSPQTREYENRNKNRDHLHNIGF